MNSTKETPYTVTYIQYIHDTVSSRTQEESRPGDFESLYSWVSHSEVMKRSSTRGNVVWLGSQLTKFFLAQTEILNTWGDIGYVPLWAEDKKMKHSLWPWHCCTILRRDNSHIMLGADNYNTFVQLLSPHNNDQRYRCRSQRDLRPANSHSVRMSLK